MNTLQLQYRIYHSHTAEDFISKLERNNNNEQVIELITATRDPVSRKVSTFFQNIIDGPYDYAFGSQEKVLDAGMDELLRRFQTWQEGIEEATGWFDKHFFSATGIDVYANPFEKDKGWQIIEQGKWRVLILRYEDISVNHVDALNDFVSRRYGDRVTYKELKSKNLSSGKWYSGLMKTFYEQIKFSQEEMAAAYDSKYAHHFYSDDELRKMKARWNHQG
ncbi:putative capsular polysaccharide synthesis family protein [Rubritalea squalenifaciens]|nr:putative capsular polysaccharide synthesis family protein [Rubritalea squalenifaciens]